MGKIYVRYKGKMAREEDIYVRRNGNQDIAIRRKEGYQYTRTEEQRQMRAGFGQHSAQVAAGRRANSDPPTPEYKRLLGRYKRIRKKDTNRYSSFWNYLIAHLTVCD